MSNNRVLIILLNLLAFGKAYKVPIWNTEIENEYSDI